MKHAALLHFAACVGMASSLIGAVVAYAAPSKTNYDVKVIACRDAVLNRLDPDDRSMNAIAIRKQLYFTDGTIQIYINVDADGRRGQAVCVWSPEHRKVLRVEGMEGWSA